MDKTLFGSTLLIGIAIGFLGTHIGNDITEEQQRIAEIRARKEKDKEQKLEEALFTCYYNKANVSRLEATVAAISRTLQAKETNGSVALEE